MFRNRKKELIDNKNDNKTFLDVKIKQLYSDLLDLGSIKIAFIGFIILTMLAFLVFDTFLAALMHKSFGYKIEFWVCLVCTPLYFLMGAVSIISLSKFIRKTRSEYDVSVKEREAEKKVQKFLEDNLTEGYHLFKNIYTGYGDIDAIIVGLTGVYVVEVKSNEGLVAKNEKGYLSVIDGDSPHKNYREQIIKETFQVKKYLDNNVPELRSWVNPVLVFPFGNPIKDLVLDSGNDNFKIPVLNEKDLLKYIYANVQYSLTNDQIGKIAAALREWQE